MHPENGKHSGKVSELNQMLDEIIAIDEMKYISSETKHRAKMEILQNVKAYEHGWKERKRETE